MILSRWTEPDDSLLTIIVGHSAEHTHGLLVVLYERDEPFDDLVERCSRKMFRTETQGESEYVVRHTGNITVKLPSRVSKTR